ncbi:MAG: hypothetical protein QNK11_08150 [Legionella sp.]|nr:hypothetical protein [Legionella sp.]
MLIKKRSFFEILFPLFILVSIGQDNQLVATLIPANVHWLLLLLLFFYVCSKGKLLRGVSSDLRIALLVYLFWCFLTITWSEVFFLSLLKVALLFVSVITFVGAGYEWVLRKGWENSITWLFPLFFFSLLSAILGRGNENAYNEMSHFSSYQGLTGNSNYFGYLQAINIPLLLWQLYKNWSRPKPRIIWGAFFVLTLVFLLSSYSRGAILITLPVFVFFMLGLGLRRHFVLFASLLLLFLLAFSLSFSPVNQFIDKGSNGDVFKTRRDVWAASYAQAFQGGFLGGGYGVSIGDSNFHLVGLKVRSYGREKGNSQLAVLEETGWIGLMFYLVLLLIFSKQVLHCYFMLQGDEKVMMALVLGAMFGLLMQSFVEAWWDAPASPESICFWMFFGISSGVMQKTGRTLPVQQGIE